MSFYKKFLIKENDQFDAEYFSVINEDVEKINNQTANFSSIFKSEIVISFLRDLSLKNEWIIGNPELAGIASAKNLYTGSIGLLFDSAVNNPIFTGQLEDYLKSKLSPHYITAN